MSNAVARPLGGLVVPARFQNRGVQESLGEGISSGFPIIRLRGSKWWLSMGKDDERHIPSDSIDVVILRSPAFASRAYYKGYKGERSKGERPLCSSLRGERPDPAVPEPQSPLCGNCPRNQTYTNDEGMKVRDCSNGKRLAVLPWIDWTAELLGKSLLRPCLLRIPGASLQALKVYGEELSRAGVPYYGLLTTLSFEKKKEYPKVLFNYNTETQLDDASAEIIDQMRETPDARFITGEAGGEATREIDHDEPPAPKVAEKPKPAAVSLAQIMKKVKEEAAQEAEEKVEAQVPLDGEVIPPPKETKPPKAAKVVKPQEHEATTKAQEAEMVDEAEGSDDVLKDEVLALLGRKK